MLWMAALGVLALLMVLIVLYLVGRQAIRKDQTNVRQIEPTVRSDSDDTGDVVFFANAFHGYFTNGGFDALLGAMNAREWSLDEVCKALVAVSAEPIVPLLREAHEERERYNRDCDASDAPIGSAEHQERVKAYLERLRSLEAAVDLLGLDVGRLARDYRPD